MEKGKEHRCEFDGLDIITDFSDRITEEHKGRYCYCPITHRATLGEIVDLLKSFAEQVSINISKPGITKGQHWHHTKFEQFIVVKGLGLIQQRCMADPQAPVLEWEVSGDGSQRMLNAIEPGSPMPIHRHRHSSETVVCLRGRLVWEYYDEAPKPSGNEQPEEELERICTETIELSPNGPVVALNVPAGQWHTVRALESGSVILEMKNGKYEPLGEEDILK